MVDHRKQVGIKEVMKTESMLEKGGTAAQNQRHNLKRVAFTDTSFCDVEQAAKQNKVLTKQELLVLQDCLQENERNEVWLK